jgi:hypothetical protein
MIDESLTLPPMDLLEEAGPLDGIEVAVLAPVTRARLARFEAALASLAVTAAPAPELAQRSPKEALAAMLGRRARRLDPAPSGVLTETEAAELRAWTAAWAEAVAALPADEGLGPLLWHVRRRAIPREGALVGVAVPISGDDVRAEADLAARAGALGLGGRLDALRGRATAAAAARINAFLAAPGILARPALMAEAVRGLERAVPGADDGDGGGDGDGGTLDAGRPVDAIITRPTFGLGGRRLRRRSPRPSPAGPPR